MSTSSSSITIVGAGSIGCYIGGWLGTQVPVRLVGRERVRDMLAKHGLELTDMKGARLQRAGDELDFVTDLSSMGDAGLVLVTVKSNDTEQVAREMAPHLREDAVVVSFQNGLRNADILREHLPGRTVLAGMVPFNVFHRGLGRLHRASAGELMVESHPVFEPWLEAFAAAGLPVEMRTDMPAVQAAKLLLNLNNAINALSNLPLREELAIRNYRRWFPRLLGAPDALFTRLAQQVLAIDPLARSSTWEDLAAGRPTEVQCINGEVVRMAQALGLSAPVNARLVTLVEAAERGERRVWRGADLWAELKACRTSA
jgi:2-dehydropantoate 2-reductase